MKLIIPLAKLEEKAKYGRLLDRMILSPGRDEFQRFYEKAS